jgi:hypothetical protein
VEHYPTVLERPAGSFWDLIPDESIVEAEVVMGVRSLEKEVAETAAEAVVPLVADGQKAFFNPEGAPWIFPKRTSGDFNRPSIKVSAVEELNPLLFSAGTTGQDREEESESWDHPSVENRGSETPHL